ncbi:Programmed cell death protein 5 [Termitomyces sp. J132]|nr:Programmed cell death protein 5 [Termitomyces sp. J132]
MEGLSQLPSKGSASQGPSDEKSKDEQEEQMRRDLMSTVLDLAARERCMFDSHFQNELWTYRTTVSRISLVSPERSKQIEGILFRMAQNGQLRGRVSENQLIELLEQMEDVQGNGTIKKSTIVFQRRKDFDDDFDI